MVEADTALLETDSSMEMEAELEKLDDTLSFIKMTDFRIGGQNFVLNHEEPIFASAIPQTKTKELSDCGTCKIVALNKKNTVFC